MRIDGHAELGHPFLLGRSLPSRSAAHAGERMLVAALPERFESLADHLGMLLGKRSAHDGSVGDLGLERDAAATTANALKRGIGLNVSKRRMFVIPLRGDYGFGDRNGDLVGSRVVASVHGGSPMSGRPAFGARNVGQRHSRAELVALVLASANLLLVLAIRVRSAGGVGNVLRVPEEFRPGMRYALGRQS